MARVINFFATRRDLLDLLNEVESSHRIHYAEAGMFDSSQVTAYASASRIPGLGTIAVPDTNLGQRLLIADVAVSFNLRAVPQRGGAVRYALDQKTNPDSVAIIPGGQFSRETILSGSFGSSTDSPVAAALFGMLAGSVRRKWTRIKSYFVGPEAEAMLDQGARLTANVKSPPEYDLKRV